MKERLPWQSDTKSRAVRFAGAKCDRPSQIAFRKQSDTVGANTPTGSLCRKIPLEHLELHFWRHNRGIVTPENAAFGRNPGTQSDGISGATRFQCVFEEIAKDPNQKRFIAHKLEINALGCNCDCFSSGYIVVA